MAGNDVYLWAVPSDADTDDVRLRDPTTAGSAPGALVGSATLTFALTATIAGSANAIGSTALIFTPSGTAAGSAVAVGSTTLTFTPTSTIAATAAAVGSASLVFTPAATIAGDAAAVGSASLTFAPAATIAGNAALAGNTTLAFTASGTIEDAGSGSVGALIGSTSLTFTPAGVLESTGAQQVPLPSGSGGGWWVKVGDDGDVRARVASSRLHIRAGVPRVTVTVKTVVMVDPVGATLAIRAKPPRVIRSEPGEIVQIMELLALRSKRQSEPGEIETIMKLLTQMRKAA